MRPKGFKVTEETKQKARDSMLDRYQHGLVPHNKGKIKSEYGPLLKVSEKMMGNKNPSGRFGKLNGMYGKKSPHLGKLNKLWIGGKHTNETKIKMSARAKSSWLKTRDKRIDSFLKVWGKNRKMTYLEKKFVSLCEKHSLPFRYIGDGKLWVTSEGQHMNPDFIDTNGKRIFVEVYAEFFKDKDYESKRGRLLSVAGFKTIFLSNVIMDSDDWEKNCLDKILPILIPEEG